MSKDEMCGICSNDVLVNRRHVAKLQAELERVKTENDDILTIAHMSGYAEGKKSQAAEIEQLETDIAETCLGYKDQAIEIKQLKERIEAAIDDLPESPDSALDYLEHALKESKP